MLTFRRILGLPMLLTAAALGWVLMRQAGMPALGLGVGAALVVGLGLWWLGWRQWRRYSGWAPAALVLVAAVAAPLSLARLPAPAPVVRTPVGGLPFDRAALDRLRAAHVPVFLYFTADWCLTCKVNEQGALSDTGVQQAFARAGIRTMVGDWTRPDPAIARFLADHGRAGIPYYVFHGRDGSTTELPQLLTAARLRALAADPEGEGR
jgi:thiol:disulfide interchange protein